MFQETVSLNFIFGTIAVLVLITAIGIVLVNKFKKGK